MMRLRGKELDASKRIPGRQTFIENVVPLVGGANTQARLLEQVAKVSNHQWPALRSNAGALTSRLCGTLRAPQLWRYAWKTKMKVIEEIKFDDSYVAPKGVCYVGIDRRIQENEEQFYVRSYDDEPHKAIVMEPEDALESSLIVSLVEFLSTEFGYSQFEFACAATGMFEEIDPETMTFKPLKKA